MSRDSLVVKRACVYCGFTRDWSDKSRLDRESGCIIVDPDDFFRCTNCRKVSKTELSISYTFRPPRRLLDGVLSEAKMEEMGRRLEEMWASRK